MITIVNIGALYSIQNTTAGGGCGILINYPFLQRKIVGPKGRGRSDVGMASLFSPFFAIFPRRNS